MALLVESLATALASDRDDRALVQLGVGDARHEVRRAGAERRAADARFAGQPAVDVGHERRALFVARRNEPDR